MGKEEILYQKTRGKMCKSVEKQLQINDYTSKDNYLTIDHISLCREVE